MNPRLESIPSCHAQRRRRRRLRRRCQRGEARRTRSEYPRSSSWAARPLSATEGRFLSGDPIEGGCANNYTYVFGDPINQRDASGQAGCSTEEASGHCALGKDFIHPNCTLELNHDAVHTIRNYLTVIGGSASGASAVISLLEKVGLGISTLAVGIVSLALTCDKDMLLDSVRRLVEGSNPPKRIRVSYHFPRRTRRYVERKLRTIKEFMAYYPYRLGRC